MIEWMFLKEKTFKLSTCMNALFVFIITILVEKFLGFGRTLRNDLHNIFQITIGFNEFVNV